ncbi:MAG: hypothetical protein P4L33_12120 [Capsulimonadaceae bacterium]|nr:hypothetical protein [Capsulimonadaceae bacterium]
MKKKRDKYEDELAEAYDDVELPSDEAYDQPEDEDDEIPERRPATGAEVGTAVTAIVVSCGMFLACLLRTTLGMYRTGHHFQLIPPGDSLRSVAWLMIADVPVIIFAAYALVVTRPQEGTALRGLAIAASALSFVNELLLGNTFFTLLSNIH